MRRRKTKGDDRAETEAGKSGMRIKATEVLSMRDPAVVHKEERGSREERKASGY